MTANIKEEEKELLYSKEFKVEIIWKQVFYKVLLHLIAFYGIYLCCFSTSWKTLLFAFVYGRIAATGLSAGPHRLWSHRSFKAKLPLRIFLCVTSFAAGQDDIFCWVRDHRAHHKYADTNADPYNIKRGFFFAHIGWLMCKKHPAVVTFGKKLSMEDVMADPVVRFNRKYYYPFWFLFCFLLPTVIPVWYWNEAWLDAFCVAGMLRYAFQLHGVFCTNSFAHTYGYRPIDQTMEARESHITDYMQPGEGSHNYHHAFPGDYRSKEHAFSLNSCRVFIELMAQIGQAYDLKLSPDKITNARKQKTGDGSSL